MSIEGQGHFLIIYFPGFVCIVLYKAKISGERLQDHWSSGFIVAFPEPYSQLMFRTEIRKYHQFTCQNCYFYHSRIIRSILHTCKHVLSVFKQRLTDNFIQGWNEEVSNSSRANTYKLLADFNFKLYLDFVTIKKFRYAFTRLRVTSHRLELDAGQWHKPNRTPVSERKCFYCNSLEDEFHFVLECSLYQELRQEYI